MVLTFLSKFLLNYHLSSARSAENHVAHHHCYRLRLRLFACGRFLVFRTDSGLLPFLLLWLLNGYSKATNLLDHRKVKWAAVGVILSSFLFVNSQWSLATKFWGFLTGWASYAEISPTLNTVVSFSCSFTLLQHWCLFLGLHYCRNESYL